MQRYFPKDKQDDNFILYDKDIHHIKNVMRNNVGDTIEVVYENKIYLCQISNLTPLTLEIKDVCVEDREMSTELTVAISLVSEQKFDLILQKLTELGVSTIIPVKTSRSIVKVDEKKLPKKYERWQTICKEASEQSHRTTIPKVEEVMTLKQLVQVPKDIKLICSLRENTKSLKEYLNNKPKNILFIIGPEGGFSQEEEEYLLNNDFLPTSLGKRVMRVETAAIYVASVINYICEG